MGNFVSRQPNGLLCVFSTNIDSVTYYNMTEDEYIEMCAEKAREEAKAVINKRLKPFNCVIDQFIPNNMTEKEFAEIIKQMNDKKNEGFGRKAVYWLALKAETQS